MVSPDHQWYDYYQELENFSTVKTCILIADERDKVESASIFLFPKIQLIEDDQQSPK